MKNIKIISTAFKHNDPIPIEHTYDGEDISPPLSWDGEIPEETKSFVIMVDDLNGPNGTFVNWTLFNIPPSIRELSKGIKCMGSFSDGSIHGMNSFGKLGYGGPCPPNGIHVYNFRIYALDIMLNLNPGIPRYRLDEAIRGHILNKGKLVGIYKRPKKY